MVLGSQTIPESLAGGQEALVPQVSGRMTPSAALATTKPTAKAQGREGVVKDAKEYAKKTVMQMYYSRLSSRFRAFAVAFLLAVRRFWTISIRWTYF